MLAKQTGGTPVTPYYFETVTVTTEVKKEIQRIFDDAMTRHGKKGDSIKVSFRKLNSKQAYEDEPCGIVYSGGILGVGQTAQRVNVTLVENPKIANIVFGQGSLVDGSIVPLSKFQNALQRIGKQKFIVQAIAATIVHEGIYHGVATGHDHQAGFIDAATLLVDPKATLSDEACKTILGKFHVAK